MQTVQHVGLEEMLQRYDGALTPLDELKSHRADAHLLVSGARCSLWWQHVPQLPNQKIGLIGHYEARDDEAAIALLNAACQALRDRGCTLAIGPMDGSTWNRYRLVTDAGDELPFFLEPWNPPTYPTHFQRANFTSLATYCSALNTDLTFDDPKNETVRRRVADAGIQIRQINPDDFESELKRIFAISIVAFRRNFLYTPISEADFLSQYAKIKPILQPELVLIAEHGTRPVGFVFAIPDMLARAQNRPETLLLKTLAVLPDRAQAGLGGLLISECQQAARKLGFTRSIFALMHDSNASRSISSRYGEIMRRYTLFSKQLQSQTALFAESP
jgi:predicted N-acetyltransferase YhbS